MIRGNTFSFNSGLGIVLYRSFDDTIIHNELDYNVRGYSHKFYARGQGFRRSVAVRAELTQPRRAQFADARR